jgi:hypothetical protein
VLCRLIELHVASSGADVQQPRKHMLRLLAALVDREVGSTCEQLLCNVLPPQFCGMFRFSWIMPSCCKTTSVWRYSTRYPSLSGCAWLPLPPLPPPPSTR